MSLACAAPLQSIPMARKQARTIWSSSPERIEVWDARRSGYWNSKASMLASVIRDLGARRSDLY